jgi:anti-anti-sigma factor
MALRIASQDTLPTSRALMLEGRLDNETAEELNDVLARELPPQIKVLVFDLQHLTYISSMGLRSLFRAKKTMNAREGEVLFLHLQPAVKKVFDIVGAVDVMTVFASMEELDAYLALMQRRVVEGES